MWLINFHMITISILYYYFSLIIIKWVYKFIINYSFISHYFVSIWLVISYYWFRLNVIYISTLINYFSLSKWLIIHSFNYIYLNIHSFSFWIYLIIHLFICLPEYTRNYLISLQYKLLIHLLVKRLHIFLFIDCI